MKWLQIFLMASIVFHAISNNCENPKMIKTFLKYQFPYTAPFVIFYQCPNKMPQKSTIVDLHKNVPNFYLTLTYFPLLIRKNKSIYVLDFSCNSSEILLTQANEEHLFERPYTWLFLNVPQNIESFLEGINILVDSDVTISISEERNCQLLKIYKTNIGLKLNFEFFAYASEDSEPIFKNLTRIPEKRRADLQKTILKSCIVITHNDSMKHLTDNREKHVDTIGKVNYVFMEHLAYMYNASMNYSIETTWGYKDNASKWTGMIGKLVTKEADIGGTALFMTVDRVAVIDYIAMTTPTRSKFVFRQPKLSYITNVFTLPFHVGVWVSLIALVLITAIGLFIAIKWERVRNAESTAKASLMDSFFLVFGAMCQQATSTVPHNIPGRIITILLFVSLMFLYTSYSANIVALLQSSSTSIQSLEDLLKSRLQVGVDDTVFNHFYFPNAKDPIRKALYRQKVIPPGQKPRFFPIEEGIKRMREGLFAFHVETGAGYKIVSETFQEHEKCGLQEIAFLEVIDPYIAMRKNSSFKKLLKIGLMKLRESGLQSRETDLMYTKRPVCSSGGANFVEVNIVDCWAAIVIFLVGIGCAMATFLLEVIIGSNHPLKNKLKRAFK